MDDDISKTKVRKEICFMQPVVKGTTTTYNLVRASSFSSQCCSRVEWPFKRYTIIYFYHNMWCTCTSWNLPGLLHPWTWGTPSGQFRTSLDHGRVPVGTGKWQPSWQGPELCLWCVSCMIRPPYRGHPPVGFADPYLAWKQVLGSAWSCHGGLNW